MRRSPRAPSRFGMLDPGVKGVMIITGIVLLLLGMLLAIPLVSTLGVILLIVGVVLMLVGRSGRQIGGRAHYW